MEKKVRVGITLGDYNGIGAEVILKIIQDDRLFKMCDIIIYGQRNILNFYAKQLKIQNLLMHDLKSFDTVNSKVANVVNCWEEQTKIEMGKSTKEAGEKAILCLQKALEDLKAGHIDVLVTAPVNKANIAESIPDFKGQTEYISTFAGNENSMMFLVGDSLKVGLVSNHIPLKDIPGKIEMTGILAKLEVLSQTLKKDFGIDKPRIAVLGLNPHSGDNGLLGKEEKEIIAPAVTRAKERGMIAMGPFSADGFFGTAQFRYFDAVLAMYHDQGLIPFKTIAFESGVNFTAGLNIIRTSPDHGTAYDIVGEDKASPTSMRSAIFTALDIYKVRMNFKEMTANPIERVRLNEEREG